MLGLSMTEVVIILALALLLLGPDQLPTIAKSLGKGLREIRKATDDLKSTFEQEMVRIDAETTTAPEKPQLQSVAPTPEQPTAVTPAETPTAPTPPPADPASARAAARRAAAGGPPLRLVPPEGAVAREPAPAVPAAEAPALPAAEAPAVKDVP
jgi:sec-independent protein translocase protein TatB